MKNKLLLLLLGIALTTFTYGQHPKDAVVSVVSHKKRYTIFSE